MDCFCSSKAVGRQFGLFLSLSGGGSVVLRVFVSLMWWVGRVDVFLRIRAGFSVCACVEDLMRCG